MTQTPFWKSSLRLTLAPVELKVAFTVVDFVSGSGSHPGGILNPLRLFHQADAARWGRLEFIDVDRFVIEELTAIHAQLGQDRNDLVDAGRYTRELQGLESLPPNSSLLFLGYFAMLESLLTHQPDPKDPLDSITRQVKSKVALLDHRLRCPLDYSGFDHVSTDKIWTKMYDYRSCLAHGGVADFGQRLAVLRDHKNALGLLKQSVKALVRHALIEPQLVADLRNC